VGVLYSPNTIYAYTYDHQAPGPHSYALTVACQGLIRAGYAFKVLHPTQLDDGRELASGYKALVLPAVLTLSAAQVNTIREFVRQGGILIADQAPEQYVTDLGLPWKDDPFRSVFTNAAGEGRYTFGKGKAFFLTEPFGLSIVERYIEHSWQANYNILAPTYMEKHQQTLAEIFRTFIDKEGGCKPPVSIIQADGKLMEHAEITTFTDGSALYLGITRQGRYWEGNGMVWKHHDGYQEKVRTTLQFPRPACIYDVMSGQFLGNGTSVEVELTSAPRLFAALPAKIDGVAVSGIKPSYHQGDTIMLKANLRATPAVDYTGVFHVAIRQPNGPPLPYLELNCLAPHGTASCNLPLALDEKPGTYEIVVTDVSSGVAAVTPFQIKP